MNTISAETKIHELKCWPEYFQAIKSGKKTFEVRKNDRDYKVGDILHLREWKFTNWSSVAPSSMEGYYTGEELRVSVTYILETPKNQVPQFGIHGDVVVMSISAPQTEEAFQPISEDVKKVYDEITRLQEKYDENGYDLPPLIKLQRMEQHIDMSLSAAHKAVENKSGLRWVKASEKHPPVNTVVIIKDYDGTVYQQSAKSWDKRVINYEWLDESEEVVPVTNDVKWSGDDMVNIVIHFYGNVIGGYYDDMGERQVDKLKSDIKDYLKRLCINIYPAKK